MKIEAEVKTTHTYEVSAIRCTLPNRYHDEDDDQFLTWPGTGAGCSYDRERHVLTLVLDLDTGKVRDWPTGTTFELHLKVCDEGTYELLDPTGHVLASVVENYVPNCVPNEYSDYVVANIGPDGTVQGWRPDPSRVAAFIERA